MDTCGLEWVERFRINLNEKNFASQKNTLTSSLRKDAKPLAPAAAATIRLSMYPTSVLLQKGHRIRVALAGAAATLFERYPALRNNQIGRRLTKFR
jgi:predicted acyl esterase